MKGTVFQKPFEFNLVIEGESWRQGDPIRGTLTVKNHGPAELPLDGIQVALAWGALSKVRQKKPNAFDIRESRPLGAGAKLAPQSEQKFSWEFPTDRNIGLTENSRSFFLIYGQGDATDKLGQLQLQIVPFGLLQDIFDLLTIHFRFVFKSRKSSKGWVVACFEPPSAKTYATVEDLDLQFHFEGEQLQMRYTFNVKGLDASAGMNLKKLTKDFEQNFTPDQYRLPNGRLNHEGMEAAIGEILGQVGTLSAS